MKTVVFQTVSGSPDTAEWHAWRAQGIGGSDAPVIAVDAGMCQKASFMKSLDWLWKLKTGQIQQEDLSNNPAVMRGKKFEEPARQKYEQKTGVLMQPMFGEMDLYPFIRSSFDGVPFDRSLLLELKVPGEKVHNLAKFGKIVDYYEPQVMHQALTLWGHPESWTDQIIHFGTYQPEKDDFALVEKPAKRYRKDAEKLMNAEIKFWESVKNFAAPCGEEFLAAAAEYIAQIDALELVKTNTEAAKQKLLQLYGNTKVKLEGGGVAISRSPRRGSIINEKLVEELIKGKSTDNAAAILANFTVPEIDYEKVVSELVKGKSKDDAEAFIDQFREPSTETILVKVSKPAKAAAEKTREVA